MGAGARQRGDKVIRQRIADEAHENADVSRGYLNSLYAQIARYKASDEDNKESLRKANALIARLRAENEVLKCEKRRFVAVVDESRRHISIAGNVQKKWAVTLVKKQLEKARLI